METTTDDTPLATQASDGTFDHPTLIVADAPDVSFVGARQVIRHGAPLLLGRTPQSALPGVFNSNAISREHARVGYARSRRVTLTDLGSRNGTAINGHVIEGPTPLSPGDIIQLGQVLLVFQNEPPRPIVPGPPSKLLGISRSMHEASRQLSLAAEQANVVLVVGETGTGKEVAAGEVHRRSRRPGSLVTLNCSGVSDTLLQSELFGHARGAFTGADRQRSGLLEQSSDGTMFLDELTDASPTFQAALLRLLETGEYRPVGADKLSTSSARFVAAVQPRILALCDAGRFRQDLWMRLSSWAITLPSLRSRPEDVPTLVRHFVAQTTTNLPSPTFLSLPLMTTLMRHPWPGNVRQLKNVVTRLVASHSRAEPLCLRDFEALDIEFARLQSQIPGPGRELPQQAQARPTLDPTSLRTALRKHAGNVRQVASHFGVSRKTIYAWCRRYGVEPTAFRATAASGPELGHEEA